MEKITPSDDSAQSADIAAENLAKLTELFPDAISEDGLNTDVLAQLVGKTVDDTDERYGLNWHGKRRARELALTPSLGTLRPAPEDSVDWASTENLMIEGDNLEVLKLLQKPLAGKVKLIYIDPPYNTGKDFIYKDDYKDNIQNYLEVTGQVDEEGNRTSSEEETAGRFHTEWLNMMYPRLALARNLLREDGVFVVSIDDSEAANLRTILDGIFGPQSFVASIAWKKRSSPDARTTVGYVHDWILCYVKRPEDLRNAIGRLPLSEDRKSAFKNPDSDPRGPWASVDMTSMTGRAPASQYYVITLPSGREISPPEGRAWGLAQSTFDQYVDEDRIWFGNGGDNTPRIKRFLSEAEGQAIPSIWDLDEAGSNDEAKKEVNALMGAADVFDTPKPVRLISRLISVMCSGERDIVLDFFAGSGTTGHAVMAQNAADGGNRRYILVQLPEILDPDNKRQANGATMCQQLDRSLNIAELTKERLRRAAAKVKEENPEFKGDLGFKVFKLDSTNFREWDPDPDELQQSLEDAANHLKDDRTEADVLYELLLKLGVDLNAPIEEREIAGKTVHSIGLGAMFVCLDESVAKAEVEPLGQGILEWRKELGPESDTSCIFRDSAFEDDSAKVNMTEILRQSGITEVRSV